MSSNNQAKPNPLNFTADGVLWFEPCGNDTVFQAVGTFGGGTLHLEETGIHWSELGMDRDTWAADTATANLWTAVEIGGSAYTQTAASGSNYINTPKRYIRFRLAGATSPAITGQVTWFKP